MDINEIKKQIKNLNDIYNIEFGVQQKISKELEQTEENIKKKEKDIEIYEKKNFLIKEVAEEARNQAKDVFAKMSTHGLRLILADHLSVDIASGEKAGTPTLDFVVKSKYDDIEVEADPAEEEGGGVADIVSLSSFLNLNYLKREINKAPLVLDEPTKFVSKGNSKSVSDFIKDVSQSTQKQIIMSTHDQVSQYIADKAYLLEKKDGVTHVHDITVQEEIIEEE